MADPKLDLALVLNRFIEDVAAEEDAARRERYGSTGRDHFYASDSADMGRKIAYDMFGTIATDKTDAKGKRVFQNGEWIQLRYEQYFRMLGIFVAREIRLSTYEKDPETGELLTFEGTQAQSGRSDIVIDAKRLQALYEFYFMGGAEDAIPEPLVEMNTIELEPDFYYYAPAAYLTSQEVMDIEAAEPGRLGIVEMKSISTYGFGDLGKTQSAKPDHKAQLALYQFITGIEHGWIVYENKNDQEMEAFYQERDERILIGTADGKNTGTHAKLAVIKGYVDAGQVPPRCDGAGDGSKFPCKWKTGRCKYFDHCWNKEHNGEYIPGISDQQAEAEGDAEEITLDELKSWLDANEGNAEFWVKLLDANGLGNAITSAMPKMLRDQMLDFTYPNAVEVEWAGMNDVVESAIDPEPTPEPAQPAAQPETAQPAAAAPRAPKPQPPAPPKVINVWWDDLVSNTQLQAEMTHEEYVALCDREDAGQVSITGADELLAGYFAALQNGTDPTLLWTVVDFQAAALSAKRAPAGTKQGEGVAVEQVATNGQKYIYCAFENCNHGDPIEFKRLGNGGVIKCPGCKQTNKVVRPEA